MVATTETPAAARPGKGAETRAAILDRAVDLASVEGLEGLTIGRLAAELEMSKSGLFAHFGSKQELQLATVDAAARRFRGRSHRAGVGRGGGASPPARDGRTYLAYLDDGTYSGGCFWSATSAEYDDRPGPVRDAIAAGLDAWLGELERQAEIAGSPSQTASPSSSTRSRRGPTPASGLAAIAMYSTTPPRRSSACSGNWPLSPSQSSRPTWRRIETESE